MTYSIHTLVNPSGPPPAEEVAAPRTGLTRFTQEFGLFVAGACLLLCFFSLLSYQRVQLHALPSRQLLSWHCNECQCSMWHRQLLSFRWC